MLGDSIIRYLYSLFYGGDRPLQRRRTTKASTAKAAQGGYFHFLVPEVRGPKSRDAEWEDRLAALESTIQAVRKNERDLKEHVVVLEEKMNKLTGQCSKRDKETTQNNLQQQK